MNVMCMMIHAYANAYVKLSVCFVFVKYTHLVYFAIDEQKATFFIVLMLENFRNSKYTIHMQKVRRPFTEK